jgi:tryptophan synthase beta subunit
MARELRYGVDPATVATTASQWAKDYTYQLVNGLTQTSQTALQSVMSDFLSTVGMTREQVVQALAPTFGVARAEVIAVTETTRAAAAGVGTGGTISGTGHYLKKVSRGRVRVIGADPVGSIYSGGDIHGYFVEGVGEDFWPSAFDAELPDEIQTVSDAESFDMTRRLAREEGMLVGGSSGMAIVAGLRVARAAQAKDVVVILIPDSGRGYLGKIFNDEWMTQNGFDVVDTPEQLDLRAQIARITQGETE